MKNYQGFTTENKNTLNKVMNKFVKTLFAEEQAPSGTNGEQVQVQPQINYEDLIAKARKEEKDKLYGQLQAKDSKINDLTEKNNNLMLKVGEQEAVIKALQKNLASAKEGGAKIESEEIAKLTKERDNLASEIEALKNNALDPKDIENRVREEYEVKMYRLEKLHQEGSNLIPELVLGSTKEEIDASIEVAKQRYNDIVSKVTPQQTQQQTPQVNIKPGNPSAGDFSVSNISPDTIASMSPKEWAEYRRKIGLK